MTIGVVLTVFALSGGLGAVLAVGFFLLLPKDAPRTAVNPTAVRMVGRAHKSGAHEVVHTPAAVSQVHTQR
jgi:hypothetical protein